MDKIWSEITFYCLQWHFTCGGGTWAHPDQWGCGGSIFQVVLEFCWRHSYSCSLMERIPGAEDKSDKVRVDGWAFKMAETKSWNQHWAQESVVTVWECLNHDAMLLSASQAELSTEEVIYQHCFCLAPSILVSGSTKLRNFIAEQPGK